MSDVIRTAQLPLYVETEIEALHALAQAVGGWKSLACLLRPELADDPDRAGRWLSDALNDEKRDTWKGEHQLRALRIGKQHDCHVYAAWLNNAAGYEAPKPKAVQSERSRLLDENEKLQAQMRRNYERLDEIDAQPVENDRRRSVEAIA